MSAAAILSEVSIVDEHVRAFPNREWDQWRRTVAPNAVYREYGTNRTTVGAETTAPTGRRGEVHAVELFTFEGEQVMKMHHCFDVMELTLGLGAGPP